MGWRAVVSAAPRHEPSRVLTTPHNAARVLAPAIDLGEIHLRAAERQLVDYVRILDRGWMQSIAWPIVVEGPISDAYWPATERRASLTLHRLCCLLSLAWNEPWQVRESPRDSPHAGQALPDDASPPPNWGHSLLDEPQHGLRDEEPLPGWVQPIWSYLDQSSRAQEVSAALSLWHQGILLTPEHPSFALVAFVASIEQASRVMSELSHLPSEPKGGNRFWFAVGLVAAADQLSELKKMDVYGMRSSIAHGGKIHGLETAFGSMVLPAWASHDKSDPISTFVHGTVPSLARLSRDLLLRLCISLTTGLQV